MRAGAHALSLLSVPLNIEVLTSLSEEPRTLIDLRRSIGSPPQTTMRSHLRRLTEMGVLDRHRRAQFPGAVDYRLCSPGQELLEVVKLLQSWLEDCPDGQVTLGTTRATSTVRALIEGWNTGIVRALAAKPLTLTELDRLIASVNYPSLERRVAAMRLSGQIHALPASGRGRPYAIAGWLRRAAGLLAAASRWEHLHASGRASPPVRIDVEAAFLLALPAIHFDEELSGRCRLSVELGGGESRDVAGVIAEVDKGRVVGCSSRLGGEAGAWAVGTPSGWFRAITSRSADHLEVGGDHGLAAGLIDGLHDGLIGLRSCRTAGPTGRGKTLELARVSLSS